MKNLTAYGKFIRKLRIDKNINLTEHAELLEVSPTFLSNMEQGKKAVSMEIINKTIQVLNLNSSEEAELIRAASQTVPLAIKITPKNQLEALATLEFAQALLRPDLDKAKLKAFLQAC